VTAAVSVFAPAKINLFLHVGEQRDDNYHALESLVVFAEAGDRLTLTSAPEISLSISGRFGGALSPGADNLVLKAAHVLLASPPLGEKGAAIALEKNLPVASGIGGGSADAAATLRGLNELWDLHYSEEELLGIAAQLGSDVPACLLSRPCWMEGRGERVTPLAPLPQFPLILINPGVMVPTAPVFANLNARTGLGAKPPLGPINSVWDLVAYLDGAVNDLEAPASRLAPDIEDALSALDREPGCVLAQMSGSGATCFGLFDQQQFAIGAAERIAQDHPEWWVKLTRIAARDIGTPQNIP
jgi:4-diphosphocytidyl-2-C-methyl-D-erythritol kinase